ncbi:hypothetical protein TD95_002374 [Thielaviopsis punctulata]|uniref:Uncharacterized protein n=1 Tax=Thielaviopsis punctulata TaxID=72032 RepID=A0A0F4ZHF4_9PEZI|nr:hypothetical protein TD95_002374 [Thielaviopsis punctulata]
MAFVAASISGIRAQSPLGMSSDGILRIDAAEALDQDYSVIMNLRAEWSSNISDSSSSIAGVSSKAADDSTNANVSAMSLSEVPLNPDGSINLEAWNNQTEAACQKALDSISVASNPSGTAICYNLPALNASSGVFQADLRLYKISDPSGSFAAVSPSNIQVQLSYNGASVSSVNSNSSSAASQHSSASTVAAASLPPLSKRDFGIQRRENGVPMLKQYMLVGQIDPAMMSGNSSMAALEALVMPTLTLSAVGSAGSIKTNVSSNEAVFVSGIFSREVVMSALAIATWASDEINAELANGTVAFVLPGQQLMIYPIGIIVTGMWCIIGFIAYGIGTYDRFMYATNYRRQLAASGPIAKTF